MRREDAAELLLLAEETLIERVDAGELLIGELLGLSLGAAGHFLNLRSLQCAWKTATAVPVPPFDMGGAGLPVLRITSD